MIPEKSDQASWFADNVLVHEPMLRAWLHSHFPEENDIDDVVQDAYVRILRARDRGQVRLPKAFLFATARNLVLDRLRHRRIINTQSLVENEVLDVLDEGAGIPETVAHNQELALLTEAIQSLPDRCRQVFTLRKIFGMPQKDIAVRLGISEHTVSAQLTIGVHKCTEFFARHRPKGR